MPLEIEILQNINSPATGVVTVKLTGSLDTATAPELERQLTPVLASPIRDLVFDVAGLKFVSSAGLRVFSITRRQIKERGGQTAFVNLQPQIKEVFEIIQALPGLSVFRDLDELDAYLTARQQAHEEKK